VPEALHLSKQLIFDLLCQARIMINR
jgi:hypothetical protein